MSKKIYIAGSWANRNYIKKEWIDKLPKDEFTVLHDWTLAETAVRNIENQQECALLDINAAINCDICLCIMNMPQSPVHAYRGTFLELGVAWTCKRKVVIFNPYHTEDLHNLDDNSKVAINVFYWLPGIIYCKTEEEVLKAIME